MPNALSREISPYLLQHADNPVDWLPWGEVAFAKARAEQKPIFLSIGYSTCHWCHVMAHESFENVEIAALLNTHFVPVKVDREERPDVDRVHMTYVQALTGHGGWPLNAWLTPELKPFHGGTYFPPEDRHGRPGFASVLRVIANGWATDRQKFITEAERVLTTLREHAAPAAGAGDGTQTEARLFEDAGGAFELCFQQLYESFDPARGDFAGAPKFPRPANLNFLFRVAALQGADSDLGREAVRMATATLKKMAQGGVHDHVGGGFHRYAVDDAWLVPHFEKMLYDQAQIAVACLDARLATGDERFAWVARGIYDYVLRDLAAPGGGFCSAEDADSASAETGNGERLTGHGEGKKAEGAFYVWTRAELSAALGADAALVGEHFGVKPEGNVPAHLDPHGEFTGKNILAQQRPLAETARRLGLAPEAAVEKLAAALDRLRAARATRPRPHLDDKIVTAWNGLMISALARGHCALESGDGSEPTNPTAAPYLQAAVHAAEFIKRELWDDARGVLFRCWRDPSAKLGSTLLTAGGTGGRGAAEGFAEDYAYLIAGLLDLYEATFDARWLHWARRLQTMMDNLFWDDAAGGYFNSAAGAADIVLRLKEDHDGAEPSPSSIAAANLLRLAALFHDDTARARALRCLGAFRARWTRSPHALPEMLCAIERALEPPRHIVLAGDPAAPDFRALAAVARERPGLRRALVRTDAVALPWTAVMTPRDGRATAYVCESFACQPPATTPDELRRLLG
jgi:uncharacterized protein YyaL (SSP411 family)